MTTKGLQMTFDEIVFSESQTIEASVPIETGRFDCVTFKASKPDITVMLLVTEEMQPCIGRATNTGMSFGRFDIPDSTLKKIVVDGVHIICLPHEKNPNFALGSYGHAEVPEIQCVNGGVIECPETFGTRVMVNNIQRYDGSTKKTGSADYFILKEGQSPKDIMTDRQKEYVEEISKYSAWLADQIDYTYPLNGLKNLVKLLPFHCPDDAAPWKESRSDSGWMTLRTCALTGMPMDLADNTEFLFEIKKLEWHYEHYVQLRYREEKEYDANKVMGLVMLYHLLRNINSSEPELRWEIAYETIPTYSHSFLHNVPHKANVLAYLKNTFDGVEYLAKVPELTIVEDDVYDVLQHIVNVDRHHVEDFLFINDGLPVE